MAMEKSKAIIYLQKKKYEKIVTNMIIQMVIMPKLSQLPHNWLLSVNFWFLQCTLFQSRPKYAYSDHPLKMGHSLGGLVVHVSTIIMHHVSGFSNVLSFVATALKREETD